jgi:DNA primase
MTRYRRGITVEVTSYDHLRGRLDTEAFLDDLGIDIGFRKGEFQWQCHCPNLTGAHKHGDANPSFGFNEDKLAYNCFVCGGGNVVELVQMLRPSLTREEAVRYLEQFADMNTSEGMVDRVQAILNPVVEEMSEILPDYPPENLFQYRKIHPYLYERGLSKEIITELQIGFDEEHMGITIPHFFMGKLVGLQRRHLAMDKDGNWDCPRCSLTDKRVPKYKNTSNFPKINTLYGYDRMKEKLKKEGGQSVIVVESPMTALKLMSLGFNRVVATFGQWSTEQGMLLIAVPTVYFWPDNDPAGYNNTRLAINSLGKFTNLKIVPVVPTPKGDAAELNTAEEILSYLGQSYPASIFSMESKNGELKTYEVQ